MYKDLISKINKNLYSGAMTPDAALDILKCLSVLTGKTYRILNLRVVFEKDNEFFDEYACFL